MRLRADVIAGELTTGATSGTAGVAGGVATVAAGSAIGLGALEIAGGLATAATSVAVPSGATALTGAGGCGASVTNAGGEVGAARGASTLDTGGRPLAAGGAIELGWAAGAGDITGPVCPKAVSCSAPQVNTKKTARTSAPARTAALVDVHPGRVEFGPVASSSVVVTFLL